MAKLTIVGVTENKKTGRAVPNSFCDYCQSKVDSKGFCCCGSNMRPLPKKNRDANRDNPFG